MEKQAQIRQRPFWFLIFTTEMKNSFPAVKKLLLYLFFTGLGISLNSTGNNYQWTTIDFKI